MRAGKFRVDGWTAIAIVITVFYLLIAVWPLGGVLWQSFVSDRGFSLDGFASFFSSPLYYSTLVNSIVLTITVTALSLAVAFPMAYSLTMYRVRGAGVAQVLLVASMMSPPFIGAYAWILLLGNNGIVTNLLDSILGVEVPSIYGFAGIVLVLTLQLVPLIFTYLMGAWKTVDVSLLEAAESMGVTGFRRAWKVIAPLLWPTILAGSLLVFVRAFADFGTPMLIGQGFRTVPVLIYSSFVGEVSTNHGFAATVCVVVMVVTLGAFLLQKYFAGRSSFAMTAMRPIEPRRMTRLAGVVVYTYVYGFLVLALAPLAVVVVSAFRNTLYGQFIAGFSFDNFVRASRDIWRYVGNTFSLGLTALVFLVIVAILVSYLTVRRRGPLSNLLDSLTMVPYVVPGLVIGIAMVTAFSSPPILLAGTAAIMVIALMMRRIPYSVRSVTALLYQLSPSVEEAAESLGASKLRSMVRVVIPALAPGIISGAVLSWVTIITELSTTLFLYNTKTQTLSLGIYASVLRGQLGTAAALSTILLGLTVASLVLFLRVAGGAKELRV